MKNKLLIALAILLSTNLYAQTKKKAISVNKRYTANDTISTFTIQKQDKDKCIERLIELWGKPSKNNAGSIIWTNAKLSGIDKPIDIRLLDGIFCTKEKSARFTTFENEKEKTKKLKDNEYRRTTVELHDHKGGTNIINSHTTEKKIVELLTGTLKNIN